MDIRNRTLLVLALFPFAFCAESARSQTGAQPEIHQPQSGVEITNSLHYEVVTIKPSDPNSRGGMNQWHSGHRLNLRNMTLQYLIRYAFGIQAQQLVGYPKWASENRYDLEILAEDSQVRPRDRDWPIMLQQVLRDRFGLQYHTESRLMNAYALQIGPNGARLAPGKFVKPGDWHLFAERKGRGVFITASSTTIPELVHFVQRMEADKPIVDNTGLSGNYDFTLNFIRRQELQVQEKPGSSEAPALPELPLALEQQLGLKLQPVKTAVDCLVVDKVEQPSEN